VKLKKIVKSKVSYLDGEILSKVMC